MARVSRKQWQGALGDIGSALTTVYGETPASTAADSTSPATSDGIPRAWLIGGAIAGGLLLVLVLVLVATR
jgi:hypothetical protein